MQGIKNIYFYPPPLYLPAKEFSDGTGEDFDKLVLGLGINKKSVNAPSQDTTSLAMNALEGLMTQNPSGYKDWKYIHVATESSFDDSKPISSELLDLIPKSNILNDDRKAACISAINAIVENVHFGSGVIIASDLGKYGVDEGESPSADFTGGSGAVAVEIGKGDLLKLEKKYGVYSSNKYDFCKVYNVEGDTMTRKISPKVDGPFSRVCYLYHVGEAYKDLKVKTHDSLQDFNGFVFHVPYPGLPKHALSYLDMIDRKNNVAVEDKILKLMSLFKFRDSENYHKNFSDGYDEVKEILKQNFQEKKNLVSKLAPSLVFPAETGNLYAGSGLLSLCSSLVFSKYPKNSRIGFFSYGSGSSSVALVFRTTRKTNKIVGAWNIEDVLSRRTAVNWEGYQGLRCAGLSPGREWNSYLRPGDRYLSEIKGWVKQYEVFLG